MTAERAREILRDHWGASNGWQLSKHDEREIIAAAKPGECYLYTLHRVAGLPLPPWGGVYSKASDNVDFYSRLR